MRGMGFEVPSFRGMRLEMAAEIPLIVVYAHPEDFPEYYVARLFDLRRPTHFFCKRETLQELQECIPERMYFVRRELADDPVVVGSYI